MSAVARHDGRNHVVVHCEDFDVAEGGNDEGGEDTTGAFPMQV